jgi:hypothetical protein
MISKSTFLELSLAHPDGNYFLRPDRILGAFHVDSTAPPVLVSVDTASELSGERTREATVNRLLQLADSKQKSNTDRIDAAVASLWPVDEVKAVMEKSMKETSISMEEVSGGLGSIKLEQEDIGDLEMNNITGGGTNGTKTTSHTIQTQNVPAGVHIKFI